jgi:hypothetical protein
VPYKTADQAAAMHAKADRGEIPREVVEHFDAETRKRGKKLPRSKGKSSALKRWARS